MRYTKYNKWITARRYGGSSMAWMALIVTLMFLQNVQADQWSTYRADPRRSGAVEQTIGPALSLRWKYVPVHAPKPAWPMPSEERPRMHSDTAYHTVIADGIVYWGSSVTNQVYAMDGATGKTFWSFTTEGPIRFAPTVSQGKLYVGSDDGYVYCLDARSGKLIWKYRPGPTGEKILGNGRMISLWPVRTGILVDNNVAYCTAGVFPYEGLYLCALNADDGTEIWKNDIMGDRSHEIHYGGFAPQGYLLASEDILYVPTGRAMPAAFDRHTGKYIFLTPPVGKQGGTWALLDRNRFIAGVDASGKPLKYAYNAKTGKKLGDAFAWFPGVDIVTNEHHSYIVTLQGVYALDRAVYAKAEREAKQLINKQRSLKNTIRKLNNQLRSASETDKAGIEQQIQEAYDTIDRLSQSEKEYRDSSYQWFYAGAGLRSAILTGEVLYVGGRERVVGIDVKSGKEVWKATIDGAAVSMSAASGALLVSSNAGPVYCFSEQKQEQPNIIAPKINPNAYAQDGKADGFATMAQDIIARSGITKGYALILECGTGRLAYELARQTELQIVALETDPDKRKAAQKKLNAAGLLGTRVVAEPWRVEDLPPYFANLITSETPIHTDQVATAYKHIERILRPYGGVFVTSVSNTTKDDKRKWVKLQRKGLDGAAGWTQQYGNPQNTACSNDQAVTGSLGLLWYGEPGSIDMVERHAKAQSPLAMNGRVFIQGEEVVMAYDAFNGTRLWRREIPGAVRVRVDVDAGNLVLTEDALYVAADDVCYRLDPATGKTVRSYPIPPAEDDLPSRWGYISYANNMLIGMRALGFERGYAEGLRERFSDPNRKDILWRAKQSGSSWRRITRYPRWENYNSGADSVTGNMIVGDMMFAINPDTGDILWRHFGDRIANITVSIGNGRVYFAESTVAESQYQSAIAERNKLIQKGVYIESESMKKLGASYKPADIRLAVALDLATGKPLWEHEVDFTGCVGDAMGSAFQDDVLLFFGNIGNHDAFRFKRHQLKYRRIVALSATDGEILWSRPCNYRVRPVVMGQTIILEPQACDLRTGEIKMRTNPVTGQATPWEFLRPGHTCAVSSASADTLFYRSACSAMYDVKRDAGVVLFGGIRPGCWINMIPASGVLLTPEASSGCTCSFPLRCSYAMVHKPEREHPWSVFVDQTLFAKNANDWKGVIPFAYRKPVRHLAINFGAPADRKDGNGTLWFGYPNPVTQSTKNHFAGYGVKFDLRETILDGMGYFNASSRGKAIEGSDNPWLFTSGCLGLVSCTVPLIDPGQEAREYTVRLGFRAPADDTVGQRIFDVKVQGKIVLKGFDIAGTAATSGQAIVKEIPNVRVGDSLKLELIPGKTSPDPSHAPLINFLEIIEESGPMEPVRSIL